MPRLVVAMVLAALLFSTAAYAQAPCAPRAALVAVLQERHNEEAIAIGVTSTGAVLEVWMSRGGESWTIVVTVPSGYSCVLAAGDAWQNVTPIPHHSHL